MFRVLFACLVISFCAVQSNNAREIRKGNTEASAPQIGFITADQLLSQPQPTPIDWAKELREAEELRAQSAKMMEDTEKYRNKAKITFKFDPNAPRIIVSKIMNLIS